MKTEESLSKGIIKRVVFIAIIMMLFMGACVFASVSKVNTVTIVFSDNTELSIMTSKTKVSEILKENNIALLKDETIDPSLESEIGSDGRIKIERKTENLQEDIIKEETISSDILTENSTIVEKIVVKRVSIPYETIKKEVSVKKGDKTSNSVVQKGKNGIKEITYKIKYENDVEIEKTKISEKVVKKPVNKIIKATKKTTSRSGSRSTSVVSYGNGKWSYSDEEFDLLCAITAQESSSSYNSALAVITTACNRAESKQWKSRGKDPLSQYKAKGQFCYSIDSHWVKRLNENYPSCVKKAVKDALNGKRNHEYLSFRSARTGHSGEKIGGNVYFNKLK